LSSGEGKQHHFVSIISFLRRCVQLEVGHDSAASGATESGCPATGGQIISGGDGSRGLADGKHVLPIPQRLLAAAEQKPCTAKDQRAPASDGDDSRLHTRDGNPVWPKNSCGLSVVVLEKTAEAFVTADRWPSLRRRHFATWE
jgi:hypothetical protein